MCAPDNSMKSLCCDSNCTVIVKKFMNADISRRVTCGKHRQLSMMTLTNGFQASALDLALEHLLVRSSFDVCHDRSTCCSDEHAEGFSSLHDAKSRAVTKRRRIKCISTAFRYLRTYSTMVPSCVHTPHQREVKFSSTQTV